MCRININNKWVNGADLLKEAVPTKLNRSLYNILRSKDSNLSRIKETFGFEPNTLVSSSKVLDILNKNTNSIQTKKLIKKLKKLNPIDIAFSEVLLRKQNDKIISIRGVYNDKEIGISLAAHNNNESLVETILHELIHNYTVGLFRRQDLSPKELKIRDKVILLYSKALITAETNPDLYDKLLNGFSNVDEFVADAFSDPEFMEQLESMKYRNKSVLETLLDFIKNLLGFETKDNISILDELFNMEDAIISDENSDMVKTHKGSLSSLVTTIDQALNQKAFNKILPHIEGALFKPADIPADLEKILSDQENVEVVMEGGYKKNGVLLNRVTDETSGGISWFLRKLGDGKTPAERARDAQWGDKDLSTKLHTDEGFMDGEQYLAKKKAIFESGRLKGNIIHAMLERFMKGDPDGSLSSQIKQFEMEGGFHEKRFDWVNKHAKFIIEKAGINIFDKNVKDSQLDIVEPEVIVANEDLGLGGRLDLLVRHSDGTISLKDFKTGFNSVKNTHSDIFRYGDSGVGSDLLWANPLNKAKLQLMLYAVLLKINNPNVKFRDLDVVWIPNEATLHVEDFIKKTQPGPYLDMIRQYLKYEKSGVYKSLEAKLGEDFKKIWDPKEYDAGYSKDLRKEINDSKLTDADLLRLKIEQLRHAVFYDINPHTHQSKEGSSQRVKEAAKLSKEILELKSKVSDLEASTWDADISFMSTWLGTLSTINSPYVQIFNEFYRERKVEFNKRYQSSRLEFLSHIKPIYNAYLKRTGRKAVKDVTFNMLSQVDYRDLYGFAYKTVKDKNDNFVRYEYNRTDEDWAQAMKDHAWLNESNIKRHRKFVDFVVNSYAQFFVDEKGNFKGKKGKKLALANKLATKRITKNTVTEFTNLDLANGKNSVFRNPAQFEYYEGFIPKVPRLIEEYGSIFKKERLKEVWRRFSSFYVEDVYEGWNNTEEAIPMKYMGSPKMDSNPNLYSLNIEHQFDKFMRAYLFKEEMDDVYALGKGIEFQLKAEGKFDNTASYMSTTIEQLLRGRTQQRNSKSNFLSKNRHNIDFFKIMAETKNIAAAPIMWFNYIGGTANGIFTYMFTLKETIRNGAIKAGHKFHGINGSSIDMTPKDFASAHKVAMGIAKDGMSGNMEKNKAYILLKKFGYLPSNWDWGSNPSDLMTLSNKAIRENTMYMFYSLPEETLAAMVMVAQLKSMKIAAGSMKGTSLWDMYEKVEKVNSNGDKFVDYVWKTDTKTGNPFVRGVIKTDNGQQELTELDGKEISRLFFVYEKMHGGYRAEERTKLDYYVFGQIFLQFKRYLPNILRMGAMSSGKRISTGFYKSMGEDKDGTPILEWQSNVMEGRWIVLGKLLQNFIGLRMKIDNPTNELTKFWNTITIGGNENYRWDELSDNQKIQFFDAIWTMGIWATMHLGYLAAFADADEDDSMAKLTSRIMRDFSQPYNPLELTKNLSNLTPASARQANQFLEAITTVSLSKFAELTGDEETAFTQEGDLRGSKNLMRTIPFFSIYRRTTHFYENLDDDWQLYLRGGFD